MEKLLKTPVLFIIFNRPDTTQKVFDEIKKVKPLKIFIAADGPRNDKKNEAQNCQKTRTIIKQINWDCKIYTLFREQNLGCKIAVSSAINWFFQHIEKGIILEDDCLPHQSFFWYCQELLERYIHDERIMMISGDNFQDGIKRGEQGYYFSRLSHIWGWATWRRAWKYYDVNMKNFPEFLTQNQIKNIFDDQFVQQYWIRILQNVYDNKIDTWDYQWAYTVFTQNGLSIMPNYNLISNIGFGKTATHVKEKNNEYANMKRYELKNLSHPAFILPDKNADKYTFKHHYGIIQPELKPPKKIIQRIFPFFSRMSRI